ncbi:MAG: Hsp70 family protein [Clostridia bacterium]|nr:Hsp70 family protein [Clostridia bacterium]
MRRKIGIDLGTAYSCVSYVDEMGVTRIIDSLEGDQTTPSVVYFDSNGEAVVGKTARNEGALHPECMVERVKNFMGEPNYILTINGQEYSPAAVSSLILKKLIADAETHFGGEEIEGAVITCPAYFGDAARDATRKAGENVTLSNGEKLKVLQILDEPVAAALAYGSSRHEDMQKTILVYDLGGGTFDCTVMTLNFAGDKKDMEIITTGGDRQLGGKDWDRRLTDYVINEFCGITDQDPDEMRNDPECRQWFSEKIEATKMVLTNKETTFLVPAFNGAKEKIEITREIFERETEDLLNRTVALVDNMLATKGLSMNDIDEIILVGGSTKMPQVRKKLEAEYGKPILTFEPDKAVAMGAALVANRNAGITVDPKCTKSYGLLALNNNEEVVANIIFKDSPKPAVQTRRFGTEKANQASINLEVYENSSLEKNATVIESVKLYESCVVELTAGLPAGAPIDITFNLDANGILKITAVDVTNNVSEDVIPVRIGGETDDIGMEIVNDTLLR